MEIAANSVKRPSTGINRIMTYIHKHWFIYLLVLPGVLHTLVFKISPIYGLTVAFKTYRMSKGILGSPWADPILKNFKVLFQDSDFFRVLWNTLVMNFYIIVVGTIFVIFLSLLLNEIRISSIKRIYQTMVYFPSFISWIVFVGIITAFLSPTTGLINVILKSIGIEPIFFLANNDLFRPVIVISGIIKTGGFSTIVYLASLAGVNQELYESAIIDGANRAHMMWYITLPRIQPTIAVLLIMSIAGVFANMTGGSLFEQVYGFLNPTVMDKGDIIPTFLYRRGLLQGKFEMATALGMTFNLIGLIIVILTNKIVKKMDVTGMF
jgi:ABC-type polysaccharide transport system, permease component